MTYAVPGPIRTNIVSSTSVGGIDSPFTRTRAVLDMMKGWEIMKAVTEGTEYLRENSEAFLPLEPREDYEAYLARVNRAVFSPYTEIDKSSYWPCIKKTNNSNWRSLLDRDV